MQYATWRFHQARHRTRIDAGSQLGFVEVYLPQLPHDRQVLRIHGCHVLQQSNSRKCHQVYPLWE
jgi:hypothetical protein